MPGGNFQAGSGPWTAASIISTFLDGTKARVPASDDTFFGLHPASSRGYGFAQTGPDGGDEIMSATPDWPGRLGKLAVLTAWAVAVCCAALRVPSLLPRALAGEARRTAASPDAEYADFAARLARAVKAGDLPALDTMFDFDAVFLRATVALEAEPALRDSLRQESKKELQATTAFFPAVCEACSDIGSYQLLRAAALVPSAATAVPHGRSKGGSELSRLSRDSPAGRHHGRLRRL